MSLDGLREPRQRPPHGWAGTILDDAATLQDEVRVLLDAFRDSRRPHGPMPFLPGSVLPHEGDRCLVLFDDVRRGRVVWWATEDSLPSGGGGGAPSGPAGGVLGGTYPNPSFAVDMATQAELDAHKASADHDGRYYTEGEVDTALALKQDAATAATDAELAAHTGDTVLDGGPHGFPALGSDGLGWLRVGGALVAVDLATQAELTAHEADTTSVHGIADTSTLYRAGGTDVAVADGGTGASSASAARTNLGLVIGTDVAPVASPTFTGTTTADDLSVTDDLTLGDDMTLAAGSVLTWAGDTNLYRDIANRLKTDDELVAGGGLISESTSPVIRMIDTDASANEKMFNWIIGGATLRGRVLNDDFTTKAEAIMFDMVTGKTTVGQELEIEGALNHDGSTIGFYGVAPVARPAAYTQTYATTTRTHPALTSLAPPAGGTGTAAGGYNTAANRDLMITSVTAIRTDLTNLKNLVNQVIDDLQANGLLQ